MTKRILAVIIAALILMTGFSTVIAEATENNQKICEYINGTLKVISYSQKWNTESKLKEIYDELLKNFHGEEIKLLSEVNLYPGAKDDRLGEYSYSTTVDIDGNIALEPGGSINIFECDKMDTIDRIARTLSHEYGHHFTYYYAIKKENRLILEKGTLYQLLRGLDSNPNVNNGEHRWDMAEIAAEDYVQLFGSPTVKKSTKFYDVKSGEAFSNSFKKFIDDIKNYKFVPYNSGPQENTFIQLAYNNPEIRQYWLDAFGSSNADIIDPSSSPVYAYLDAVKKINIQSYGLGIGDLYNYTFKWTPGENDNSKNLEYTVVAFPDVYNGEGIPVKTVKTGEELSACIGYFETYAGHNTYYDVILENSKNFFDLVVYIKDENDNMKSSNILRVDIKDKSKPKTSSVLTSRFDGDIRVMYKGQMISFSDAKPQLINGSTLVPLRRIFETMGAKVEWEAATSTITATKDDTVIKMQINNKTAAVSDSEISLSTPPQLINGSTYVPLRFISQSFGNTVDWDGVDSTVIIK